MGFLETPELGEEPLELRIESVTSQLIKNIKDLALDRLNRTGHLSNILLSLADILRNPHEQVDPIGPYDSRNLFFNLFRVM